MKKIITLCLSVLLLTSLAGCGKYSEAEIVMDTVKLNGVNYSTDGSAVATATASTRSILQSYSVSNNVAGVFNSPDDMNDSDGSENKFEFSYNGAVPVVTGEDKETTMNTFKYAVMSADMDEQIRLAFLTYTIYFYDANGNVIDSEYKFVGTPSSNGMVSASTPGIRNSNDDGLTGNVEYNEETDMFTVVVDSELLKSDKMSTSSFATSKVVVNTMDFVIGDAVYWTNQEDEWNGYGTNNPDGKIGQESLSADDVANGNVRGSVTITVNENNEFVFVEPAYDFYSNSAQDAYLYGDVDNNFHLDMTKYVNSRNLATYEFVIDALLDIDEDVYPLKKTDDAIVLESLELLINTEYIDGIEKIFSYYMVIEFVYDYSNGYSYENFSVNVSVDRRWYDGNDELVSMKIKSDTFNYNEKVVLLEGGSTEVFGYEIVTDINGVATGNGPINGVTIRDGYRLTNTVLAYSSSSGQYTTQHSSFTSELFALGGDDYFDKEDNEYGDSYCDIFMTRLTAQYEFVSLDLDKPYKANAFDFYHGAGWLDSFEFVLYTVDGITFDRYATISSVRDDIKEETYVYLSINKFRNNNA